MTSTSVLFVLFCLLIINQEGLGYVRRNLNNDLSDDLDNDQQEVLSQRQYPGSNNYGYTKDNFNVYYNGYKINDASVSSFRVLSDGYAKDAWNAYFRGQKIIGASVSSFEFIYYGYAKDNWSVYFGGRKIEGASASSFKVLQGGYAQDSWNQYYMGQRVSG